METKTPRTPDEIFDGRPYGRLVVPDADGGYTAEILEFPGCISEGDTAAEAVQKLEENAKEWIESELEQNHSIPEPVSGDEYSGRIALRLPRSLHRALAVKAELDRTSINQEIVSAVAAWTGIADVYRGLAEKRMTWLRAWWRRAWPVTSSAIEWAILRVLGSDELSTLDIAKGVSVALGRRVALGRVHVVLWRMESAGVVVARWGDDVVPERLGCRERYYRAIRPVIAFPQG